MGRMIMRSCHNIRDRIVILLSVQLRVVPEYAHTVFESPIAAEVIFQPLLLLQARIELVEDDGELLRTSSHFFWEGKLQPVDNLP